MPTRWPTPFNTGNSSSRIVSMVLSSIAKTSNPASRQLIGKSTRPKVHDFAKARKSTASKPPNHAGNSGTKESHPNSAFASGNIRNTLSTLSTLSRNIAFAGTGTFASTLLALYLATKIETSAHNFLYHHFPHLYYEVEDDCLPFCIREVEMARRNWSSALEKVNQSVETRATDSRKKEIGNWQNAGLLVDHTQMMDCLVDDSTQQDRILDSAEGLRLDYSFRTGELKGRANDHSSWFDSTIMSLSGDQFLSKELKKASRNSSRAKVMEANKNFQESLMSAAMTA